MKAMPAPINLLPKRYLENLPFRTRFFLWTVRVGRILVVVTQAIVIGVFLLRFKLDREIADLTESIENKIAILAASEPFENQFRRVQDKLIAIDELKTSRSSPRQVLDLVAATTPEGIELTALQLTPQELGITALTKKPADFGQFVEILVARGELETVTLTGSQLQKEAEDRFSFSLRITFKKGFFTT